MLPGVKTRTDSGEFLLGISSGDNSSDRKSYKMPKKKLKISGQKRRFHGRSSKKKSAISTASQGSDALPTIPEKGPKKSEINSNDVIVAEDTS